MHEAMHVCLYVGRYVYMYQLRGGWGSSLSPYKLTFGGGSGLGLLHLSLYIVTLVLVVVVGYTLSPSPYNCHKTYIYILYISYPTTYLHA